MNTTIQYVGQHPRKRHQCNPALKLWWDMYYQNMRVNIEKGPLIENYLATLLRVMENARRECPRIFAVRIDPRFPARNYISNTGNDNSYIRNFINHLQWELDVAGTKYPHKMRYVWCREQVTSIHHHYHVLLLLSGDAYRSLGNYTHSTGGSFERDNLYHRIVRAWSVAIGWPLENMEGLVHIATDDMTHQTYTWHYQRNDQATFEEVFRGASYMCKEYSKPIGQSIHCFEGSRR
ncbi:inovirus-type Gp2 protein [Halomonas sp. XH26]|uniref:YagK/YfjJ domain-containing protein n=1 Tax=unclassified Halomonas TaxID=2609666 RepID=UPI0009F4BF04|nr:MULTISPECIES: inovirus-type Gp2 protein [unclassified Halomonas]UTA81523.1 inovirus-type Gp2 protein [Halomonas sp. XH26]